MTDCNTSVTSSTFASDDLTAELGSYIISDAVDYNDGQDGQHTDVSEDYDDDYEEDQSSLLPAAPMLAPILEQSVSSATPLTLDGGAENAAMETTVRESPRVLGCGVTQSASPCQPMVLDRPSGDEASCGSCGSPDTQGDTVGKTEDSTLLQYLNAPLPASDALSPVVSP